MIYSPNIAGLEPKLNANPDYIDSKKENKKYMKELWMQQQKKHKKEHMFIAKINTEELARLSQNISKLEYEPL